MKNEELKDEIIYEGVFYDGDIYHQIKDAIGIDIRNNPDYRIDFEGVMDDDGVSETLYTPFTVFKVQRIDTLANPDLKSIQETQTPVGVGAISHAEDLANSDSSYYKDEIDVTNKESSSYFKPSRYTTISKFTPNIVDKPAPGFVANISDDSVYVPSSNNLTEPNAKYSTDDIVNSVDTRDISLSSML